MKKAWEKNPPADWLVAAYLKYEPPKEISKSSWSQAFENTKRMASFLFKGKDKTP